MISLKEDSITITGNRLRVIRLELGMTFRQAAAQCDVDAATFFRAESGREPSLTNALKIARGLGFAVEELWELEIPAEASNG